MTTKPILSEKYINKIKKLYYDREFSAREISEKLGVSMSVVYKFMIRHKLKRRNSHESNLVYFEKTPISYKIKKNLSGKEKILKIAGIMIYWAEGAKSNYKKRSWMIDLANSDPEMVKVFLKFLRIICGINEKKIRAYIYAYSNQNIKKLLRYWNIITKIPLNQFNRPYIKNDFLQNKKDKMKYGLIHIRYNDKRLLLQIEDWIKKYYKGA